MIFSQFIQQPSYSQLSLIQTLPKSNQIKSSLFKQTAISFSVSLLDNFYPLLSSKVLYNNMDHDDCSSSSSSSNEHLLLPSPASASSSSRAPVPSPKRKAGRKKFRETRHPVYRGVRERNSGKWVCEVREPNKKSRIWLGTYPTPEMAARAHDVAAIALRGKSAVLNFEDSAWLLPHAASGNADEIRRVASEVAEMFRPVASPRKSPPSPASAVAVDEQAVARAPPAVFVDEEALFNMPGLLREMAEGLMLTPPGMQGWFDGDGGERSHMDVSLWSN